MSIFMEHSKCRAWKVSRSFALLAVSVGLAVHTHAQSFLTNGLVAYFPFNGNANDASGNEQNGTVSGAVLTTNRFGYADQAYRFGGSSAYITVPLGSSVFSNDFTASVWFNASDIAGGFPTLLLQQSDSPTQFNPFQVQIAGDSCGCDSPGYLVAHSSYAPATFSWFLERRQQTPIGTYCQVVVTKAGPNMTMYLNSEVTVTGQVFNPTVQPGNTLWIGRAATEDVPGAYVFHGVLDDIRIYNRAFSPAEVQELYKIETGAERYLSGAWYETRTTGGSEVEAGEMRVWLYPDGSCRAEREFNDTPFDQCRGFWSSKTNALGRVTSTSMTFVSDRAGEKFSATTRNNVLTGKFIGGGRIGSFKLRFLPSEQDPNK